MIRRLYPEGKKKAFNVTYDDGVLQDARFVSLLNRYGLKGTFNLNSGLTESEFEWTHENGMIVKRLSAGNAVSLYQGHEIASHTLTHPFMTELSKEEILHELCEDKKRLEELFGRKVRGFALPFDYYSDLIETCVRECGFEYARISEENHSYRPDSDYYRWRAGIFHLDPCFEEFISGFLATDTELALCQIAGHTYDLDAAGLWDKIEKVFSLIADDPDVCPTTTIDLITYLKAMEKAAIAENKISNHSECSLWFDVNGSKVCLRTGETYDIKAV